MALVLNQNQKNSRIYGMPEFLIRVKLPAPVGSGNENFPGPR